MSSWSVAFNPIGSWFWITTGATIFVALNLAIYWTQRPFRRGRLIALILRCLALLMCLLAVGRPSVLIGEKKRQATSILVLVDSSASMMVADEANGQTRWQTALESLTQSQQAIASLGKEVEPIFYRFDSDLNEFPNESERITFEPKGKESALGSMLEEAVKRNQGKRIAAVVLMSDGASNSGMPPVVAAEQIKARGIPVFTVGLGSEAAGPEVRDIIMQNVTAGPTVFVKNEMPVRGTALVRGFPNQDIKFQVLVDNVEVATTTLKIKSSSEIITIDNLKHIFETPGEKRVSLRAQTLTGESITSNNEASTYVDVLKGGLGVLYVQSQNFSWEYRYLVRGLDASPDINVDFHVLRKNATATTSELPNELLNPGRYDVVIIGDAPTSVFTNAQLNQLATLVDRGVGLLMLGGRSSFGPGGWGTSPLARHLPVDVRSSDGEITGKIPVQPAENALDNYVLRLGANLDESRKIWSELPPIEGANNFTRPKDAARILARSPDNKPLLVMQELGQGRTMAFAGETWVWARATDASRNAHRRFWRQMILWLAHKEDKGENQIKITLDRRQLKEGQKLDVQVRAYNGKGELIPNAVFQAKVSTLNRTSTEKVELYAQGSESKGAWFAGNKPAEYQIEVTGQANGSDLGQATARFLVEEDHREMENPAANLSLMRQISNITSGKAIDPNDLTKTLQAVNLDAFSNFIAQTEYRIWDNWPFLLAFVVILMIEWWLRRRLGWV